MTLPLDRLDDTDYEELRRRAVASIPTRAPQWTDHNPSDPGIMLVELMAWLTDILMYQVDQISDRALDSFRDLLGGPDGEADLDEQVLASRRTYRAVHDDDVVALLRREFPGVLVVGVLAGVRAVGGQDSLAPAAAHRTVVVHAATSDSVPDSDELEAIRSFLDVRRLVTTHFSVTGPRTRPIRVRARLHLRRDAVEAEALELVRSRLRSLFDPRTGGRDGTGWPLGRAIDPAEVAAVLDAVEGPIDHVEVAIVDPTDGVLPGSLTLQRHEIPTFIERDGDLEAVLHR